VSVATQYSQISPPSQSFASTSPEQPHEKDLEDEIFQSIPNIDTDGNAVSEVAVMPRYPFLKVRVEADLAVVKDISN
jgi:hypothetical protein